MTQPVSSVRKFGSESERHIAPTVPNVKHLLETEGCLDERLVLEFRRSMSWLEGCRFPSA